MSVVLLPAQPKTRQQPIRRRLGLGMALAALLGGTALADPLLNHSRNSFGMPGLIDLPSAEMTPDGELGLAITAIGGGTSRGMLTFQISPRLIGAFRYSRIPNLEPIPGGGYRALYDRSFDIRWQFLQEGRFTPALAVGLNDFIGTGVYSSEYIVATKSFGDRLHVTAGLGWGRLGSFGSIGSIGTRPSYDYASNGGNLNSNAWFRGDFAPFFGLSYKLNDRFALKAEYSSDGYDAETRLDGFESHSAFNFGIDYHPNQYTTLQLYAQNGSRVGFQISRAIDPKSARIPSGLEKAPLPVRPRPPVSADPEGWSGAWTADPTAEPAIQDALSKALIKDGQVLHAMSLSATHADLRVQNEKYEAQSQALGRVARTATRALPPSVETITVTLIEKGIPVSSTTFRRAELERLENTRSGDILASTTIVGAERDPAQVVTPGLLPRFQWSLKPYSEVSYFDPDSPLRLDAGLALRANLELGHGFFLSGELRQKALGNLSEGSRSSSSIVPHVRSDVGKYQQHGDMTLRKLTFAHYGHPATDFYTRVTAGYLERMYGGISGEVLWKPVDSRLGLGLEMNWVKQRDFDQRFGFQDYSTVTGHVSAYYDFGKGYVGTLDMGRYLAKDWGATVSFDREFANGWRMGAFATITDMSSAEFGEGAFDKGIHLTIPVGWMTGKPTRTTINTTIRPLLRDGGAKVSVDDRLFETVRSAHMGALYDDWGRFWR